MMILNFSLTPVFWHSNLSSTGTTSNIVGHPTRGGNVIMDLVQALMTSTITQMGGTLANALKSLKSGRVDHDFISCV
jgi:hypothetical protein